MIVLVAASITAVAVGHVESSRGGVALKLGRPEQRAFKVVTASGISVSVKKAAELRPVTSIRRTAIAWGEDVS